LFDAVLVVTDSDLIYQEIVSNGGKAIMSIKEHKSGSDRIAEAIADLDADIIINVQGDEPFVKKEPLEALLHLFNDPAVRIGSLMRKSTDEEAVDPNCVKVVVDKNNDALYFSRSTIPHARGAAVQHYLHVGVYGYRKDALLWFTNCQPSALEQSEKLEQLRFLENGKKIKMAETDYANIAIDTPADLEKARQMI
jgi:3-deoxy-manno-octulosonate cytidylyltransferase (CMP-KDO synthetase)